MKLFPYTVTEVRSGNTVPATSRKTEWDRRFVGGGGLNHHCWLSPSVTLETAMWVSTLFFGSAPDIGCPTWWSAIPVWARSIVTFEKHELAVPGSSRPSVM